MSVKHIEIEYRQDDEGFWGWFLELDGVDFDSPYASLDTALEMARLEARFLNGDPNGPERPKARLQVRATTYKGTDGFKVIGTDTQGRHVSIFTEKRETAEHIRERVKAGRPVESADWALDA